MASRTTLAPPPTQEQLEVAQMMALANQHHFTCFPKEKILAELGRALVKRMIKRRGHMVYQMVAFNLPYFPRELLKEILPQSSVTEESPKRMAWELTSLSEIASTLSPLLARSPYVCAGSTKAFRTKSERVIRVVAKMMPPLEVVHEVSSGGVERFYLNGMYTLATENGELHFPKDNNRRELEIEGSLEKSLREEVLKDVRQLGNEGHPISPNWWRQLGDHEKANEVEKSLAQSLDAFQNRKNRHKKAPAAQQRAQRTSTSAFEINRITNERRVSIGKGKATTMYLVRWAGYDASWEPWRISGQAGDPIETWEPARLLNGTLALREWKEGRHPN